jgi:DNA-binding GntR family transcriptional regulator
VSTTESSTEVAWLATVRKALRGSGVPAWLQVRDELLQRIQAGEFAPGEELPREALLADAYAVSKPTLRKALADLARAGYIRTLHGVGNIITPRPARRWINGDASSPLDVLVDTGPEARIVVLEATRLPGSRATRPVGAKAAAANGKVAFTDFPGPQMQYRYVSYVGDEPWSLTTAIVPASLAPHKWDGRGAGLLTTIEAEQGLTAHRDEQGFSAVPADLEDASRLGVPIGNALLHVRLTHVDDDGRTIAYVLHRLRGDRAEYITRVPH